MKLFAVLACVVAACGTDDRPETLAYITETILAPSCGTAECHSAMKKQSDYAFDSVAGTQAAIALSFQGGSHLVELCANLTPPQTPPCSQVDEQSFLLTVITYKDTSGNRMPRDQPLQNLDVELIANWIRDGADGYTP